jgi:hypothetical protein
MKRRSIIVVGSIAALILAALAFFGIRSSPPQTSEEEVLSTVLTMAVEGIIKTDETILLELRGSDQLRDDTARRRLIRAAKTGNLTIIDVHPKNLKDFSYQNPSSGDHAHELSIEIVEWRSETEVVVATSFSSAPLVGGGGTFSLRFDGTEWKLGDTIESWVT